MGPRKIISGQSAVGEIFHLARSICSKVLDVKLGNDLKLQHYIAALELKSEVQTWRVGVACFFFGGGKGLAANFQNETKAIAGRCTKFVVQEYSSQ